MSGNKVASFRERFNELISESPKTDSEIARDLGISKQALSTWKTGEHSPKAPTVQTLARYFSVNVNWLLGFDTMRAPDFIPTAPDALQIKRKRIPILSSIQCGEPTYAQETFEGYLEASQNLKVDYALIAKGDSMINAGIHNGDLVFVRKQQTVNNGDIAVILIGDETTLKRVYLDRDELRLVPENPAFRTQVYTGEELENIQIIARCVYVSHVLQ
ncbi:MAG: S24 family peptidase [Candidatus Limiplasma sp.]|nr:S24 family peptidase [Candidatus Limiplasma sp.]